MSHEDNLVYLFTHFAKHYRETGVGIRQALDLYVYQQKHPDIDKKKVLTELKRLQLERFYANMQQVLKVWFHGEEHTEASRIISDRLFASGVFGNETNRLYFTSV